MELVLLISLIMYSIFLALFLAIPFQKACEEPIQPKPRPSTRNHARAAKVPGRRAAGHSRGPLGGWGGSIRSGHGWMDG